MLTDGGSTLNARCTWLVALALVCLSAAALGETASDLEELMRAAKNGDMEKLEELIAAGANVNATVYGSRPLHFAVLPYKEPQQRTESVRLLLEAGAEVDGLDSRGATPLMSAVYYRNREAIAVLIDAGANVAYQDPHGNTPLSYAEELSQKYNDPRDASGLSKQYEEVARLLREAGAANDGLTPLMRAAASGNLEQVRALIAEDASAVRARGRGHMTALHEASAAGHLEIVKALIAAGADPNALSAKGPSIVDVQIAPLDLAADGAIAGALIDGGASLDRVDRIGVNCALGRAVGEERVSVVRVLLDRGVTVAQPSGACLLCVAVATGRPEVVRLLLDAGAPIRGEGWPMMNAFEVVCSDRFGDVGLNLGATARLETARMLVDAGADIERPSFFGNRPLHNAAATRHEGIVALLLDKGAEVNAISARGKTALDLAETDAVRDLIANRGGKTAAALGGSGE